MTASTFCVVYWNKMKINDSTSSKSRNMLGWKMPNSIRKPWVTNSVRNLKRWQKIHY